MSALALPMTTPFAHEAVLLHEVVAVVAAAAPRLIIDCTVGGGGHAQAMLDACPQAELIGLDRDAVAIAAATVALARFGARARLVHTPFSGLADVVGDLGGRLPDVVLVDLGVSSHQLDVASRGFSFRADGPLDMRMDTSQGQSAAELIASLGEDELADAIHTLGEERHARRVARAVSAARPQTTAALATLVRQVVRPAADGLDPATRTFQALRMLVNRELDELGIWLASVPRVLADGGVALAIAFHSLEDRAVKHAFREAARDCTCPRSFPVCVCAHRAELRVVTSKPVRPSDDEARANPRARSARLRVARRLPRVS